MSVNGPVFLFLEGLDFPLTFDDEPQSHSLNTACG